MMEIKDCRGFSEERNWYKGNLHSHTVNSDGHYSPEEAVSAYRKKGYSFLCLSEHDLYTDYTAEFNRDDFILLPGVEGSAGLSDEKNSGGKNAVVKVHHIIGIKGTGEMQKKALEPLTHMMPVEPVIFSDEEQWTNAGKEMVSSYFRKGMISFYCHPSWSRVTAADMPQVQNAGQETLNGQSVFAVELFNYNTHNECGMGYNTTCWDTLLDAGKKVWGIACDDNHNQGSFDDAMGGWINVKADALTHDNIIRSLLLGNYYSSSGPEIYDFGVKDGKAYIKTSPVHKINFIAGNFVGAGGSVMADHINGVITEGEFPLNGKETYIRAECVDQHGKTAWTNPLFLRAQAG